MFFEFSQNNSGGVFKLDKQFGIAPTVWIQADSFEEANLKAEEIGIYFNGCDSGTDCPCCGDRWYSQYSNSDGTNRPPKSLGGSIEWVEAGYNIAIHYSDGSIKWI